MKRSAFESFVVSNNINNAKKTKQQLYSKCISCQYVKKDHSYYVNGRKYFYSGKMCFCYKHYQALLTVKAITIQRMYIGYKHRKLVKRIKLLPIELKHKILFYIKQEHNYNKYKKIISNIVIKKINSFIVSNYNINDARFVKSYCLHLGNSFNLHNTPEKIIRVTNYIFKIFYLLDKYKETIKDE